MRHRCMRRIFILGARCVNLTDSFERYTHFLQRHHKLDEALDR